MKKPKVMLRCFWCSKQPVPVKRGRLSSHLTPGGIKCVGIGQPAAQVARWNELRNQP